MTYFYGMHTRSHYIIALGFVLILIFRNVLQKLKDNSRRNRTMAIKEVIVQAVPIDVKTVNAS
jgi:hypothetical protein